MDGNESVGPSRQRHKVSSRGSSGLLKTLRVADEVKITITSINLSHPTLLHLRPDPSKFYTPGGSNVQEGSTKGDITRARTFVRVRLHGMDYTTPISTDLHDHTFIKFVFPVNMHSMLYDDVKIEIVEVGAWATPSSDISSRLLGFVNNVWTFGHNEVVRARCIVTLREVWRDWRTVDELFPLTLPSSQTLQTSSDVSNHPYIGTLGLRLEFEFPVVEESFKSDAADETSLTHRGALTKEELERLRMVEDDALYRSNSQSSQASSDGDSADQGEDDDRSADTWESHQPQRQESTSSNRSRMSLRSLRNVESVGTLQRTNIVRRKGKVDSRLSRAKSVRVPNINTGEEAQEWEDDILGAYDEDGAKAEEDEQEVEDTGDHAETMVMPSSPTGLTDDEADLTKAIVAEQNEDISVGETPAADTPAPNDVVRPRRQQTVISVATSSAPSSHANSLDDLSSNASIRRSVKRQGTRFQMDKWVHQRYRENRTSDGDSGFASQSTDSMRDLEAEAVPLPKRTNSQSSFSSVDSQSTMATMATMATSKSARTSNLFANNFNVALREFYLLYKTYFGSGWKKIGWREFMKGWKVMGGYYERELHQLTRDDNIKMSNLERSRKMLEYAVCAYGTTGKFLFGTEHMLKNLARMGSDKKAIMAYFKLSRDDMIVWSYPKATLLPNYYIVRDPSTNVIVLAVRGSMSIQDALTDLRCEVVPFEGNMVHKGMLTCAEYILEQSIGDIVRAARSFGASEVVCVGHSLGAGIAACVTYLLRTRLLKYDCCLYVHGYTWGCPPWFSAEMADACKGFIESFVNENDVVSRMNYENAMMFRDLFGVLVEEARNVDSDSRKYTETERLMKIYASVTNRRKFLLQNPEASSMYVPGTIYYLYDNNKYINLLDGVEDNASDATPSKKRRSKMEDIRIEISDKLYFFDLANRVGAMDHHSLNNYRIRVDKAMQWLKNKRE